MMDNATLRWEVFSDAAALYRGPFDPKLFTRHLEERGALDRSDTSATAWAAIAYLGPRRPPTAREVATISKSFVRASARGENPINIAVAHGCGWNRSVDETPWGAVWARAMVVVTQEFARSLAATTRLIRLVSDDFRLPRSEARELSYVLGVGFVHGCRCGRHRRNCDGTAHSCCVPEHSILNWDPKVAHLSAYVDQAVRGLAGSTLKGAAFANGMLYREMRSGMRIHRATIEGFQCAECSDVRETGVCPVHGRIINRPECRRVGMLNRLVVPVSAGGSYDSRTRLVCGATACGSLFVVNALDECPRCQWRPANGERIRRQQVWVRIAESRTGQRDRVAL